MLGALRTESENWLRLDMLRFVAAAAIIWHHSSEYYGLEVNRSWGLFVDLFFVLSGFILAALYTARVGTLAEIRRFLQKRVARLIPLHLLVLTCLVGFWYAVRLVGAEANNAPDLSAACIAHNALLLNAFFECGNGIPVNEVSWSIGVEFALYLLVPLLALLARKRGLAEAAFAAFLILLLLQGETVTDATKISRGLPSFLLGALLFKHRGKLAPFGFGPLLPITLFALVAAIALRAPEPAILALIYAVAIVAVAGDTHGRRAPAWVRKLALGGVLTYGLYMWHPLINLVLMNAIGDKLLHLRTLPMIGVGLISYAAVGACSYWSWVHFEQPARRAMDSIGYRPRTARSAP